MSLKKIICNNPEILTDKKRLKSLFADVFNNDASDINAMIMVYDIDIVTEMEGKHPLDNIERGRLVKLVSDKYSMVPEKAAWAIDIWNEILDSKSIDIVKKQREQEAFDFFNSTTFSDETDDEKIESQQEMMVRNEYENYYINPKIIEEADRIYIPCGIGNTDNGFNIFGIRKALRCSSPYADVFALVYNFLIRNTKITDSDIPEIIKSISSPYIIDYRTVFRLAIILLQLIKNNYAKDGNILNINYSEDEDYLKYALRLVNHYAAIFSRLMKIDIVKLRIKKDPHGKRISLRENDGVYVKDCNQVISNARELWYGRKIRYNLAQSDITDLESILQEISPFDCFKEGQFESLCNMLASNSNSVCIMPTGSGKSLIFYLASFLQPLPLFIVAPTDILIKDQIRNLGKFHHIDNVAHLLLTSENCFDDYKISNSLNYLTPTTLQNRHMLSKFRYINSGKIRDSRGEHKITDGPAVAYIVLDEIHCLSNWGHDFRPEYLMLSKFLNKYLDQIPFWGFTATANYTVVEDIQRQLGINKNNFFSPVAFEKNNIDYEYISCKTTDEMLHQIQELSRKLIARRERTIVFTKNDVVSKQLQDIIGYEADIFLKENTDAYHHFVDGECDVLIASEDVGIGVNFPGIRNVIHFGMPLSKNEYVQQVGRAGRENEHVMSFVLYLEQNSTNIPKDLLKRNIDMNNISSLVSNISNDYADAYNIITNNCPTKEKMYSSLDILHDSLTKALYVNSYSYDELEDIKSKLYMLYVCGYVNDWYSYRQSANGEGIDLLIDIRAAEADSYVHEKNKMKNRMRRRLAEYFTLLSNNREIVAKVERANSEKKLIRIYVDWYYDRYLYHHNEQFLDMVDFIVSNGKKSKETITEEIKEYFTLPFIKIKSDESRFKSMSFNEVINNAFNGVSNTTLANIERINSNAYDYRLDFLLFFVHLQNNDSFDIGRLDRIFSIADIKEKSAIIKALSKIYQNIGLEARLDTLRYIENSVENDNEYRDFLVSVYHNGFRDIIYYGIMAQRTNQKFDISRRNQYV